MNLISFFTFYWKKTEDKENGRESRGGTVYLNGGRKQWVFRTINQKFEKCLTSLVSTGVS